MDQQELKTFYSEIIRGFSSFILNDNWYYIKHFTHLDNSEIDIQKQKYLEELKSKGAITYPEKIKELIKSGRWTEAKENEVKEVQAFIQNLNHTKSKYTIKKDIQLVEKDIENYNIRLLNLIIEREKLIGKTADKMADQKINEYYIYYNLYKYENLKERYYTYQQFDEMYQIELDVLLKKYNEKMSVFNGNNLKKIALMPYFFNIFILAGDNLFNLFGKPLIELTFYQIELIQNAKQYKNILQNSKVQPSLELLSDPDKLFDWFNKNQNLNEMIGDTTVQESPTERVIDSAKSIVGASKEELKQMGVYDETANKRLQDELKKKGELNMMDIMKLNL